MPEVIASGIRTSYEVGGLGDEIIDNDQHMLLAQPDGGSIAWFGAHRPDLVFVGRPEVTRCNRVSELRLVQVAITPDYRKNQLLPRRIGVSRISHCGHIKHRLGGAACGDPKIPC